jgi:hypothetical protein
MNDETKYKLIIKIFNLSAVKPMSKLMFIHLISHERMEGRSLDDLIEIMRECPTFTDDERDNIRSTLKIYQLLN